MFNTYYLLVVVTFTVCCVWPSYAGVGNPCSEASDDNCTSPAETCNGTACVCNSSTHYLDGSTCKNKGTHGGTCSTTVGDSSCLHSLNCTSNVCSCTTPATEYFDPADNTCKNKGTHNEACSTTVGDSSCLHSLNCTSNVCSCTTPATEYFDPADNTCKNKGTHNEACSTTVGDSSCLHSLNCTSNVCSCTTPATEYFDPADNTCKNKGTHNEACSTTVGDSSCLHSLNCTSNVCSCTTPATEYFDPADNTCKNKGTHGGTCSTTVGDSSCLHSLKCTSNICSCTTPATEYFDPADKTCKNKGTHNGACSTTVGDSSCLHSLKCTSNICSCTTPATEYFDLADYTCKNKGTHGGTCSTTVGDSSCLHSLKCISNVCLCTTPATEYFDPADKTCKNKGTHNEACSTTVGDSSCLHSLNCTSNVCSCTTPATEYFDPADNTCKNKGTHGGTCSTTVGDSSCLHSLKCTSNICSCTTPATEYFDPADKTCKNKGTHGGTCSTTVGDSSCLHSLKCTSNICSCTTPATEYFDPTDKICKNKKQLGISCTTSVECLESNSECATKCQCKSNYFDTNNDDIGGSCKNVSLLKVTNIRLRIRSETFLVFEWNASVENAAIEEYKFQIQNPPNEESVGKNLEANVTGLTPGHLYTVFIISVDSNSRPDTQRVIAQGPSISTTPAAPGPLDLTSSDLAAADGQITVRWQYTGVVSHYTVSINDSKLNQQVQDKTYSAPSVVLNGALNGHRYQITLRAHSNSLESVAYTEIFRTVITQPNPPTNLNCTEVGSTGLDLNWIAPALPNGDIMYYLIDTVSGPNPLPSRINTTNSGILYTVENLHEDMTYWFQVITVNDGIESIRNSNPSNTKSCKTKAGLSSVPTDVIASMLSSRNVTISWNQPTDPKGSIFGYRARLMVGGDCKVEIIFYCPSCADATSIGSKCPSGKSSIVQKTPEELNATITYVVSDLLPLTEYELWITAYNPVGDGDKKTAPVSTDSEVPQKPINVTATIDSATEITVSWNQPGPRPGVTTYHVKAYEVVNGGQHVFVKFSNETGFSKRTTKFTDLEEYWNYTFAVVARTDKGDGPTSIMSGQVRTSQAAPGKVKNLKVTKPEDTYTQMKVSWSIPDLKQQNGIIDVYKIEHNITNVSNPTVVPANKSDLEQLYNVTAETGYDIKVYAVNVKNMNGIKSEKYYFAVAGPPITPDIPVIDVKETKPVISQTTIAVKFSLAWFSNTDNGQRTDGGIILCPADNCDNYGKDRSLNKVDGHFLDTNKILTWKKSKAEGFVNPYRVTNTTWIDSQEGGGRRKRSSHEVELVIGEDTDCDERSDTDYCNGPLPPGTSFRVVAFVCSAGGCTESQQYGPYTTQQIPEDDFPIAIVAGAVAAVVFAIIVLIIVVIVVRARRPSHKELKEDDNVANDFGTILETPSVERKNIKLNRPIKMADFADKVYDLHKDSNLKFAHEYEEMKTLTNPSTMKGVNAKLAETEQNKLKNRYVNILPYDQTIVKLLPLADDDEDDTTFINANYIPGYTSQREYIATQGPIPSTIDDFWRMVWEQNVSIIVMLTLCKEDGRTKCECYWPLEVAEAKQYGEIVVQTTNCSTINTYDFRIFQLSMGEKTRTVKHFHFLNWRDFSADVQNDVLVDFITNVRSHVTVQESRLPMIVHCSAGVGRTGTFIAVDHMIQFIRDHDWNAKIDIFDLVHSMRKCRNYMVQTEQQYIFIHDCVKDLLEKKRKKEMEDENIYMNNFNNMDENIYENKAFDAEEPSLYDNVIAGTPKTVL